MSLQAGAAEVVITPPIGVELEGYGARTAPSTGVHDNLYAHALVLDDVATRVAIVSVDLIGVDRSMVERIRAGVAERAGIAPDHLMVSATHTHGGPRGLIALRASADESLITATVRQIVGGVAAAAASLRPARLYHGTGRVDGVAQNRRFPDGPTDPVLRVIRIDADDGEPIAALVNFTCHPTVMNYDNLQITADYPGQVYRTVRSALGVDLPILFLNGACADINPARVAAIFPEVRRIGTIVGAVAARVLAEVSTADRLLAADNLLWSERVGLENPAGFPIRHPRLRAARQHVSLALREADDEAGIERRRQAAREQIAALGLSDEQLQRIRRGEIEPGEISPEVLAERRAITARLNYETASLAAARRAQAIQQDGGRETLDVEVQAIGLGDGVVLVGVPGELMVELGARIRDKVGLRSCLVCGYTNDYAGYIVTADAVDQGGYESGMTVFAPDEGARLADAAARMAAEVGGRS